MGEPIDTLVAGLSEVVTLAGPDRPRRASETRDLGVVPGGAIAIREGRVVEVGPYRELRARFSWREEVDGGGGVALPGFCDPHTHAVFVGDRDDEWAERLGGATYAEIAARGGGIRASVRRVRAAGPEALLAEARPRLLRILAAGTTAVEIKSGYGLSLSSERAMLGAIAALGRGGPLTVVPTFLGAHEVPDEHRQDREGYLRLLTDEMLPMAAGRARYCDVFCERGVFSVSESRRVLEAGKRAGLRPKVHADELSGLGGAELAAEVGAVSADHLVAASAAGIRAMAEAGVVAVLLPGTSYFLQLDEKPDVAEMRDAGVAIALGTDCNPGSCPTESMAMVMSLACQRYGLTPEEALVGATVNAAFAMGEGARRGSLAPGKAADIAIYACRRWRQVPYHFGVSLVDRVLVAGRTVYSDGRAVWPAGRSA